MLLPFLRLDSEEHLIALQEGEFFMRPLLYYQILEECDYARNDPYDGSIPTHLVKFPSAQLGIHEVKHPRIILGNSFVKCFFTYKCSSFRAIEDGKFELTLSSDDIDALRQFSCSHALVIANPIKFIYQVQVACEKNYEQLYYGNVLYKTDKELLSLELDLINQTHQNTNPAFIKNIRYKNQSEYRFCIIHPIKSMYRSNSNQNNIEVYNIKDDVKEETYTINIGSIRDISYIVPFDLITSYPIILDIKNGKSFLNIK